MLQALIVFAATEGEESSKTAFYLAGGLLAAYAVVLSAVGLSQPDFPSSRGATRGLIALSALLVAATMAAAVITG